MAGKHISVTHVAGAATKLMGNGAQHGVAVAAAAMLCNRYGTSPRGLYEHHSPSCAPWCTRSPATTTTWPTNRRRGNSSRPG